MIAHIHMPSGVPITAGSADGIVGFKTWVIHIGAAGAVVASQAGVLTVPRDPWGVTRPLGAGPG